MMVEKFGDWAAITWYAFMSIPILLFLIYKKLQEIHGALIKTHQAKITNKGYSSDIPSPPLP
jgi:hypothetical protein